MPKIDRSAPCPCGSGKKHEECCGRKGLDSAPPPPEESSPFPLVFTGAPEVQPADMWKLERATAIVEKLLSQHDFTSIEEANAFLQRLVESGEFQRYKPQTPLEEAQEVMYQAWQARGPRHRVVGHGDERGAGRLGRVSQTSGPCACTYTSAILERAQRGHHAGSRLPR